MNKREQREQIRLQKQREAEKKAQQKKYLSYAALAGLAIVILLTVLMTNTNIAPPPLDKATENDHGKGPKDAPLTLIEYSDFQCPACRIQNQTLQSAWQRIKYDVRFVYRHFPISRLHSHATLAAYYAEAAGKQGKFWEMHDVLFDKQKEWSKLADPAETFDGYAQQLKLDISQLKQDVTSDEVKNKVLSDIASARKAGINSTPTLYLEGEVLSNARDRDVLIDAIKDAKDFK